MNKILKYIKSHKQEIYIIVSLVVVALISYIIYRMNSNTIKINSNKIKKSNYRIGVCTWYNDGIKEYADIARDINQKYCDLHGYDFIVDNVRRLPDRNYAWECIPAVLNVLNTNKYDYVVWIDADAFFRLENENANLLDEIINKNKDKDFILSNDVPGYDVINLGAFIVKNNNYTKDILQTMINSTDEKCKLYNKWPAEQVCMIHMYNTEIKNKGVILPVGDIQSWSSHYKDNNEIFKRSLILHLAGSLKEERIEIMTKFKKEYGL